jgi:hypothetical protein
MKPNYTYGNIISEIEKIKAEICDKYCRFPEEYRGLENGYDRLIDEKCEHCPLRRL